MREFVPHLQFNVWSSMTIKGFATKVGNRYTMTDGCNPESDLYIVFSSGGKRIAVTDRNVTGWLPLTTEMVEDTSFTPANTIWDQMLVRIAISRWIDAGNDRTWAPGHPECDYGIELMEKHISEILAKHPQNIINDYLNELRHHMKDVAKTKW